MFEEATGFTIAADLRQTRDRLIFAGHRLAGIAESTPRPDARCWAGPAGWAYQYALAVVAREVEAAAQLLRSATDLTSAALYELGQGD